MIEDYVTGIGMRNLRGINPFSKAQKQNKQKTAADYAAIAKAEAKRARKAAMNKRK